ncbi:uncharacterized protein LOC121590445 isoform X3 [Anopheles merus]|uniref:uncharacterized protein LOC121590445 isoform X3 n=1 Tax=Anopheles merus TaxID=30066 RepID=UPI001BE4BBB4|nr:uncharacterized protein LOC121590445 isoform X3 [Anopheles merus]
MEVDVPMLSGLSLIPSPPLWSLRSAAMSMDLEVLTIMRRNERTQHWWKAYEFNLERNGRSEACVTVRDESKHS